MRHDRMLPLVIAAKCTFPARLQKQWGDTQLHEGGTVVVQKPWKLKVCYRPEDSLICLPSNLTAFINMLCNVQAERTTVLLEVRYNVLADCSSTFHKARKARMNGVQLVNA
jgi:hypothetical protein